MPIAAIGIGSNEGDALANVQAAVAGLRALGEVTAVSRRYRTKPWGVEDQPDFVNAAALLATALEPRALLSALQALESQLGRRSTYRWGPRIIDLDILYYGDQRIHEPDLVVPHPRLMQRQFVLAPLADIDPRYRDAARSGYAAHPGECTALMFDESDGLTARVRRLAVAFEQTDLIRLRVSDEGEDAIELHRRRPQEVRGPAEGVNRPGLSEPRRDGVPLDVIRADLVGVAHLSKPVPPTGSQLDGDRELAYVEALGIRNPVRSRGPGRLVSVLVSDGEAVEYGQPLFEIQR